MDCFRAASNNYFHFQLNWVYFVFVYQMSEKDEKCQSHFPGVERDVLKCLILSDNPSKTPKIFS